MLLFTLLTTLFLGTPGAPAKDTLPVVNPPPSIGLFYITGPRALSSQGFVGPILKIPLGKTGYSVSAFLGGYSKYSEYGYRTVPNSTHLSGIDAIPVTYSNLHGACVGVDLMRNIDIGHGMYVSFGLQAGAAQIWSKESYASLPEQNKPSNSSGDTTRIFTFDRFSSEYTSRTFWLATKFEVAYQLLRGCTVLASYSCGPRALIERRHTGGNSYVIKGPYSPFVNGRYDPYNEVYAPIRVAGTYGDYNYASLPTINRFDVFGTSFFSFSLQLNL